MNFQKCEFCEHWEFRNVNFAKNEKNDFWIITFCSEPSVQNENQIDKPMDLAVM